MAQTSHACQRTSVEDNRFYLSALNKVADAQNGVTVVRQRVGDTCVRVSETFGVMLPFFNTDAMFRCTPTRVVVFRLLCAYLFFDVSKLSVSPTHLDGPLPPSTVHGRVVAQSLGWAMSFKQWKTNAQHATRDQSDMTELRRHDHPVGSFFGENEICHGR
jgi:hypothetical protein